MNSVLSVLAKNAVPASILKNVRDVMFTALRKTSMAPLLDELSPAFVGGKMLRARLTLAIGAACHTDRDALLRAAAAVEMVHAASLLHDDVIDDALLRRGVPTFWKKKGVSGAILLGDLLVCQSMLLLQGIDDGRLGNLFVRLASDVCDAEVEQELILRTLSRNWATSVSVARRKTGSLFAFAATAAEMADEVRAAALLEAGYRIGTAYQLADDILDACGVGVKDGKDLGKDARKGKTTAVSASGGAIHTVRQSIQECCASSLTLLSAWPEVQCAWDEYLQTDFGPVVRVFSGE